MKSLMTIMLAILVLVPEFVDAKGFRGSRSSFSSSRSSSSSSSFFSRSSSSKPSRSYGRKTTTTKKTYSNTGSTKSYGRKTTTTANKSFTKRSTINRSIGIKGAKANSKVALSKFKAKSNPKTTPKYTSVRKDNKVVGKIATTTSPAKLRTYNSRRETFYTGYNPPMYVYNSAPSFGAFDAMFLWMMLDRPSYHSSYYHHQRDPGFQEWRREAEKQAATNAELKAKLAKLDASVNGMKGTAIDPSFVPEGVDADLMLSEGVVKNLNKELTTLKLAVASTGNNYWNLGNLVKKNTDVGVNLVTSAGSMENLKSLTAGSVDAAIVQADAFKVWQKENPDKTLISKQAPLYKEYIHILANRKSGIKKIADITTKNVVYLTEGSGSEVTWKAFGLENSKYSNITIKYASPNEALLKVSSEPNAVMVFVSGLNSNLIKNANNYGDTIKLVDIKDDSLDNAVDQYGNKIYTFTQIPGDTYKKLQDGMFFDYVNTLSVDAVLVLSDGWKKKQGQPAVENITASFVNVLPDFKKTVERNGLW